MAHHGTLARQPRPDCLKLPGSGDPGLFGRLFDLPPLVVDDARLLALAKAMRDVDDPDADTQGDSKMPAGFTYLGQFIDHDVTLDTTPLTERIDDPEAVENFRTPALDLDSVYGLGPAGSPHLYERDPETLAMGARLLTGTALRSARIVVPGQEIPDLPGHDLPRSAHTGLALIGDPRNDENLLVAQLHVAFIKFHNKVVDHLRGQGVPAGDLFERARQLVTWHYQWLVLHEFLGQITGDPGIAERIVRAGRRHNRFVKRPFMPVEYAVAAYRFGHSMVRERYDHNAIFRKGGATPATLGLLFSFTAKSGRLVGSLRPPATPLPQPVLPSNWVIDWRRFFDFGVPAGTPDFRVNFARKINPLITPTLHSLPGELGNEAILPFRNLKRGVMMQLPSGQDVARAMRVPVLKREQLGQGPDGAVVRAQGLDTATPLWYYILKEAEVLGRGEHLGPVGGGIVAEVLVGLVQGSASSYLGARVPFVPSLGARPGEFTMVDLLKFAGVVNPIDGV